MSNSIYSDLTDEELAEQITMLKQALITDPTATSIRSVAGEGRRIEYASKATTVAGISRLLRAAQAEQNRRAGIAGTAIGVVFP